jgi:cyclase
MSTHHGDDDGLPEPRTEEVADGVFAYVQPDGTWWINNTGFVVADDGVVAIDTCSTERRTRAFLAAMRQVSPAPLRVVVNTHHHGDHTHGNHLTHPATIVAHERCRDLMIQTGIQHYDGIWDPCDWGDLQLAPPILTFDDHIDVWAGDTKAELHYIGTPAHTTNDIVAWLPAQRVLFAGDLVFNGGTPFVMMGSVAGSLAALARLRQLDAAVIVPGHGPVCTPAVLDRLGTYYAFVQRVAAEAHQAGVSPLDAARGADLSEFEDLTDPERLVGNLHRAMFEVGGGERGAAIDLAAAMTDMIAYNDGRPLRCLA